MVFIGPKIFVGASMAAPTSIAVAVVATSGGKDLIARRRVGAASQIWFPVLAN